MKRKPGLGRGLDALIPSSSTAPSGGVDMIAVEAIQANPRQPRSDIDDGELAELADSIREHGVLQPLILTRSEKPGEYVLIAGERRLRAAKQSGLARVPAIVREASEQQRLELALIENLQRTDLSPLEMAEAYRQLVEEFSLSHEEIAARVAKSRVSVTNTLRLLNLSPAGRDALAAGKITEGHARALLALSNAQSQSAALATVIKNGLNVRQTEELVRRLSGQKTPLATKPGPSPEIKALQERLESALGFPVNLNQRKKGGTLVIHYYDDEDLNTLIEKLAGES
jgi:ParB family chromosome partitioning protein